MEGSPPPLFFVTVACKGLRYCTSCLESTLAGGSGGVAAKGVSFDRASWVREQVFLNTEFAECTEEEGGRDATADRKLGNPRGRVIGNDSMECNYCKGIVPSA